MSSEKVHRDAISSGRPPILLFQGEFCVPVNSKRMLLNIAKLNGLGWQSRAALAAGIESTYRWFLQKRAPK